MQLRTQTINMAKLCAGLMTLAAVVMLTLWRAGVIHLA